MRSHSSGDQGVSLCLSRDCMGHQHWLASVSLSDPVNVYDYFTGHTTGTLLQTCVQARHGIR
jgi:hypothetical protein